MVHRDPEWFTETQSGSQRPRVVHRDPEWFTETQSGSQRPRVVHRDAGWFTETQIFVLKLWAVLWCVFSEGGFYPGSTQQRYSSDAGVVHRDTDV